jgi:hypothetical protein
MTVAELTEIFSQYVILFDYQGIPSNIPEFIKKGYLVRQIQLILFLTNVINAIDKTYGQPDQYDIEQAEKAMTEIRENLSRVHFDAIKSKLEENINVFIKGKDSATWTQYEIECFETYLYALRAFEHQVSNLSVSVQEILEKIKSKV